MRNLDIKPLNEQASDIYTMAVHRHHAGDAGFDLYVLEDVVIKPGESKMIKLGISAEPLDGKAYWLAPRSSISKTPLLMNNSIGLIDGGYRGELMASVFNKNCPIVLDESQNAVPNLDGTHTIKAGVRLFQLVHVDMEGFDHIEVINELSETTRGHGGFGSTGK